jgi:hypothetical protein
MRRAVMWHWGDGWHEAAHVAAARCFGFSARVALGLCPDLDRGDLARTYIDGDGDPSPLARSIISYMPVELIAFSDRHSAAFSGDRAIVERGSGRVIGPRWCGSSTSPGRPVNSSRPNVSGWRITRPVSRSRTRTVSGGR